MEALRKGIALIMGVLGFFFPNIFFAEEISLGGDGLGVEVGKGGVLCFNNSWNCDAMS